MNRRSFLSASLMAPAIAAKLGAQSGPTLKEAYKNHFYIGAAVSRNYFGETDATGAALVKAQFSSITPENELKWQPIHPRDGNAPEAYNFEPADKYVEFGLKNNMYIIGHCLVWHSQVPQSIFRNADSTPVTREVLLQRMKDHITTVVTRYRGKIKGWDVVNEALNEDGTMRKSQWFNIIGEDFIEKAFQYAAEADPNAQLHYNDYNLETPAKCAGAIALAKRLKAAGIKITTIGTQSHDKIDRPSAEQHDATIKAIADIGLKAAVTEFDIDVLPAVTRQPTADVNVRAQATADSNPYVNGLPDEMQKRLATRYAEIMSVFLKYKKTVDRVTFWGVTDRTSWLNGFPAAGRTNHPLLFDREYKPKPAYYAVIEAAQKVK